MAKGVCQVCGLRLGLIFRWENENPGCLKPHGDAKTGKECKGSLAPPRVIRGADE